MENEEDFLEDKVEDEDDLLNFDLDDLTPLEMDQEKTESEEKIIELTDLVEKGEPEKDAADDEVKKIFEEDQAIQEEETIEVDEAQLLNADEMPAEEGLELGDDDLDVSLTDLESESAPKQEETTETEDFTEDDLEELVADEPEQDMALDLESSGESEESLGDLIEEEIEKPVAETGTESPPQEEVSDAMATDEMTQALTAQEQIGISEEKIEAIITKVVQDVVEDVVERVTRETMANVAEKVITEAIESLKQSIDSASE